jgi:hypothetical protein
VGEPDETVAPETEIVAARAEDEGIDEGVDHEPDDQAHGGQGEEDWQVPIDDADEPRAEGLASPGTRSGSAG